MLVMRDDFDVYVLDFSVHGSFAVMRLVRSIRDFFKLS
jgi:hypothetical protein